MGAPKLKKPTELRENLFETLERTCAGEVFLIHHKSGASVLQNETEYYGLLDQIETLKSINRGLQDYLDGKTHSTSAIKTRLLKHAKKAK
jgi:hypothetical protein